MFNNFPDIVNVQQVSEMLNIGRSSVYTLLQNKQIRHVKIGRKYLIPKLAIVDFLGGVYYNQSQIINSGLELTVMSERSV